MKHVLLFFVLSTAISFSQSFRSLNNKGIDHYKNREYSDAETNFKKAIELDTSKFNARFNLGNSYYKQNNFSEAEKAFHNSYSYAATDDQKARIHHNLGNTFLQQREYEKSIDEYKKALKLNPKDADTKYNLSYALEHLAQQKQQNQNQKQNNQQQKQQNDKQQQNQNQDKQKQNNDQQKQNQDQQDQNQKNDQQRQNQPQKMKMSPQEAERILAKIQNDERDLQEKQRKKPAIIGRARGKQW
jgi:tetratricopeptide (TPR) repeat protein